MQSHISWFSQVLRTSLTLYFQQECSCSSLSEVKQPQDGWLEKMTGEDVISFDERLVLMLALMPHLSPQILDVLFLENKDIDRPYTEFGGWKGLTHGGFLPTGETAAFILAGDDMERRLQLMRLFDREHWFYRHNVLHLESSGSNEPALSGQLCVTEEFLCRTLYGRDFKPDFSSGFPAKRIVSSLDWQDLVLDYHTYESLQEINTWINGQHTIMEEWGLKKHLKAGYRALFYGPPGTGKTLAATLIGKKNEMDVYRVDLSMIVSKYIGETEKNLARIFDMAENRNWILFFDEADSLFGKRTAANTSNDRHANQEVAFLLQRIEDFPGTVILATNLRTNIDEAFSRRFQSIVYFPMPDLSLRMELWRRMLPPHWLGGDAEELIKEAAQTEMSGGSISNVIRRCAIYLLSSGEKKLTLETFLQLKAKEQ